MDATVIPLPRELTTPPVTKMYLVICSFRGGQNALLAMRLTSGPAPARANPEPERLVGERGSLPFRQGHEGCRRPPAEGHNHPLAGHSDKTLGLYGPLHDGVKAIQ